jgi:hypothetical protein
MESTRNRIVVRLLILACAIAAIAGAFAASALAEEGTTTTPSGETPTGGEAVTEPVLPPVKETVEAVTTPKKEATAPTEPTTAPQTAAPSGSSTATGGGSSGSSSPTATAPVKISAGPTQTSTPTHGGGGGGGGQGVHHASDLTGTTASSSGASHSSAGGPSHGSSAVLGASATSAAEESTAADSTEASEPEATSGHRSQGTVATHPAAKPHVVTQVGDARAVEVDPKPASDPASAALTTVGHVLSRPFKAPTSSSALLIDLCILFGVGVLGLAIWLELGGGWDRRRLADLVYMARRGRGTD